MKKETFFTILYVVLIISLILFMIFIVLFLLSSAKDCLSDPLLYYANQTNLPCYCIDLG